MRCFFWTAIIILLFIRFQTSKPVYKSGDSIRITSKVYTEPIVYEREQYLVLKNLKVYLPKYPEITYGDLLVVEGVVEGDRLKIPKLISLEKGESVFKFRSNIIDFYKKSLPEPYSSLVAGIVIGSKNMPDSFWQTLKDTGTAHVVVASGTNITMLAGFLTSSLTLLINRKKAIPIALVAILLYIALSGFDAPIVRAGIMGSILFLGQAKGKLFNSWRILIYTGIIMLFVRPDWIVDLGFILSFVATMSLMLFQEKIENYLKFVPVILKEGLSTSIAAQIGVAPIIFITFGQFNILSPFINALVLWTISYIMVFGALGGIIGLFVPILGKLILFLTFPFSLWFIKILEIFS